MEEKYSAIISAAFRMPPPVAGSFNRSTTVLEGSDTLIFTLFIQAAARPRLSFSGDRAEQITRGYPAGHFFPGKYGGILEYLFGQVPVIARGKPAYITRSIYF